MREYGPPNSPPPKTKPKKPKNSYVIDCVQQYTYVWPKKGKPFWFYPTRLEEGEVSGYRWNEKKWVFYGFEEKSIDEVACYPVQLFTKVVMKHVLWLISRIVRLYPILGV